MKHIKLKLSQLNRLNKEDYQKSCKSSIYILIDDIRSGLNIGSIFRTCDAFRVDKVFLTGISPTPPNKEILKTALGSTENVSWEYYDQIADVINMLKNQNVLIYAVEQTQNSIKLNNFEPDNESTIALIFGNEVDGVKQEVIDLCDGVIEIPQFGTKHSLNVAVSAGITIWHIISKRMLKLQNS